MEPFPKGPCAQEQGLIKGDLGICKVIWDICSGLGSSVQAPKN